MDYIANSKNRKLKKQILVFLDRLNFGVGKLPISGRFILLLTAFLGLSLFFPWFHFEFSTGDKETFYAFSSYTGYIGYGIMISIAIIPFFLLSHTKKEVIRAHIPFRLSDTQMVVFIASMLMVAMIHLFLMSSIFTQFTIGVKIGAGLLTAMSVSICIIVATFFLSQSSKQESISIRHIDHQEVNIPDEYAGILGKKNKKTQDDENMVLPI